MGRRYLRKNPMQEAGDAMADQLNKMFGTSITGLQLWNASPTGEVYQFFALSDVLYRAAKEPGFVPTEDDAKTIYWHIKQCAPDKWASLQTELGDWPTP